MAIVVKEGFVVLRVALVLASLSPVFLVWAIRGSSMIPDAWLWWGAAGMVLIPLIIFLIRYLRVKNAKSGGNLSTLTVRRLTDRREHLLSYLFPLVEALRLTNNLFIEKPKK